MQEARLKILLEYLQEEPHDPFNRYAVAMEYMKSDVHEARKHLELLYAEHTGYLPLYYQLGQLYTAAEDFDRAEKVYTEGIGLARKMEDVKTEKELRGAYQIMKDEREEW
ncbi:tetratricopeptide repeat protein [Marinilongibacter aquaticus]|uniref:tetratricopeptide repeat protein n=1 Tax=Marinilongibacter aquaticus TaxID=2975157 RepID=UPI0021BD7101|nr:tetratricopeptide repeat protein [Marinilongibacter aquaticus]UBM58495.1 tetratricopeptide repeat protein [Marinilongibacter aquaticus]